MCKKADQCAEDKVQKVSYIDTSKYSYSLERKATAFL